MNLEGLNTTSLPAELANKHVLFDTCVISNIFRNPLKFTTFLGFLDSLNCKPAINDLIYLEFIRIANKKEERTEIENFLGSEFRLIPCTQDVFENTKILYPLYNHCKQIRNRSQVSVVDAMNVAYLQKYSSSLYFITFDHGDYPLELVERVKTGTIDLDTDILTWAFYRFNQAGFNERYVNYFK